MIVSVVSLLDLSYKLTSVHVSSSEIIVKSFIAPSAGLTSYSDTFWHICIILSKGHAYELCTGIITLKYWHVNIKVLNNGQNKCSNTKYCKYINFYFEKKVG